MTSYDEIPYMGRVHSQTHPQRLATIAKLFNFPAPPIKEARILELGCGDGSNILNIAYHLPDSYCVGIDASEVQIKRGEGMIKAAKITNAKLVADDLLSIDESWGTFDYILCHGVFSWVPAKLQHKILEICKNNLTDTGIAYISYNTNPGWHLYGMLRGMMRYHADKMEKTEDKIAQAKAMMQFITLNVLDSSSAYGQFLHSNISFISRLTDEYLYHEYLEADNHPFYFHQFVQLASEFNLQYLGDTEFHTMTPLNYPKETKETLEAISPTIFELEQYMDFLRCRRFRCSLLIKDHHELKREVPLDPFFDLRFRFRAFSKESLETDPAEAPEAPLSDEQHDIETTLHAININDHNIDEQDLTAADVDLYRFTLELLNNSYPQSLHFSELIEHCSAAFDRPITLDEQIDLCKLFQSLFVKNLIHLELFSSDFVTEISERPILNPLARYQLTYQQVVNSLLHDMILVSDPWLQALGQRLTGEFTLPELILQLQELEQKGELESPFEEPPEDPAAELQSRLEKALQIFADHGALIG
jgi:SAM-dependent methyltransferase